MAILLFAFSTLNLVRAPGYWAWKPALLATELGHFLCILPILLAIWALGTKTRWRWANILTVLLSLGATAFYLKPVYNAAAIARSLPGRIDNTFTNVSRSANVPFSIKRLFEIDTPKAHVRTLPFHSTDNGGELKLDFYQPFQERGGTTLAPCVVVIHGGGWENGSREELVGLNHWLTSRGYAVAAIDYRLAPAAIWPAQRQDVAAALAFLKEHSKSLGIDPRRIVLFGRSAGGQIASAYANTVDDPDIRGVACFYAPHDMRFAWKYGRADDALNSLKLLRQYLGGPPEENPTAYDSASAVFNLEKSPTKPTLLVHGKLDTLVWVEQSRRLSARMHSTATPYLYLELPWATHAFEFNLNGPGGQLATYALDRFLQSNLAHNP